MNTSICLKNCPFCGGEAKLVSILNKYYFCTCEECNQGTAPFLNVDEAVEEWNKRANDYER